MYEDSAPDERVHGHLSSLISHLGKLPRSNFFKHQRRITAFFLLFFFLFYQVGSVYAATFTPGMSKRNAPGPFSGSALVQGEYAVSSYNYQNTDTLTASIGTTIYNADGNSSSPKFYSNFDDNQGSIVLWVTPEWNGNDNKKHTILSTAYATVSIYKSPSNSLCIGRERATNWACTDISGWVAGNTYLVVGRWDASTTLDGTNYASISVNDVHTYGATSALTTWSASSLTVGTSYQHSDNLSASANALIEGLTIYRRPLFDGIYGIDVGNGDEIAQIYNSGTGKDPTLITGSWDVVFALPTNQSTGNLTSGTGNAWSHPHSSNLLYTNTTNTGGFMMNGTYTSDGWANEGTPTSVVALATSEKIFAGGYKVTSGAANEGIYYDKTVTAGDDWVVRALAHSDGTCVPKIILYDQTNGAEIGSLTGTTTSTRTDPDTFVFTGEAPSGMTTLRTKLINTAISGTCYWHQVEVLSNLINNPSFETGSGDPWIPTGWNNNGMTAGQSSQEITIKNSGNSAFKWQMAASGSWGGILQNPTMSIGTYYAVGVFGRDSGGNPEAKHYDWNAPLQTDVRVDDAGPWFHLGNGALTHGKAIFRAESTTDAGLGVWSRDAGTEAGYIDDYYYFALTPISLTITPASQANSTENTDEIRVDGRDTYVASSSEAASLGTTTGYASFNYRPRHSAANVVKFAETTNADAYVATFNGDANDYIRVYWDAANTLRMSYSMNGTTGTSTWDATGAIAANTEYELVLSYTGGSTMTLSVDGTNRITLSSIPSAFGTAPNTVYFGSDASGANQGDATFSALTFDNSAPSISLTPLFPDPTADNTPTLSGTATESIGTVSNVQFQMDSTAGSWSACTATDGAFDEASEPFSCTASALSDGSHTMHLRATDSNGNTTGSGSESSDAFVVDTTGPSIPGTPSTTSPTSDTTPTWSFTASTDATSELASTPYTIQWSQSSTFASGVSSSTSNTNSFTHSTPLTDGTWYFRVKAADVAGNESGYSSNGSVQINTGAPTGTVTINSGAGYTNNRTVTLTLTASSGFFSDTSDIQMKVSNLADLSDADYEAFSSSKSWTLTTGDSTKTVYVQFKDATDNESGAYTDTIVLDTVSPTSFDLQDPGSNSYTNSERPTFKWKAARIEDATAGLSKYKLEVDNGSSGDFIIDNITPSRTTPYEALNYRVEYEGFNDNDNTNNYISVYTRSSVAWGSDNNDGKLKEGKRTWKVIAYDSAGNMSEKARTVYIDRKGPNVEITQINDTKSTTNNFSTTDKTPTIFGKITDSLSGDSNSSNEQERLDNQVVSGPKSVEVTIYKKNNQGGYDTHSLATLNLNETYWTKDDRKITDNSENKADKYSTFEFTPETGLSLAEYRIKIKGKDKADNTGGETTFNLTIATFQAIATPEEQEAVEKVIDEEVQKELPGATDKQKKEIQEEVTKDIEITKAEQPKRPSLFQRAGQGIVNTTKTVASATGGLIANAASQTWNGVKVAVQGIGTGLSYVGNGIATVSKNTASTIADGYNNIATAAPDPIESVMVAAGNGVSTVTTGIETGISTVFTSVKAGVANVAFFVGEKTQNTSETIGFAFVKFGYLFVNEPTTISNVQAEVLSDTSVKITWTTNHPANGKVNWGYDAGFYDFEQQTDKRTTHHEFILNDLKPDTGYHYEVMSQNKNYVYDANRQFRTPKGE